MMGLTRKQADALRFIRDYVATNGYSPSIDDIAAGISVVKSSAHALVRGLEARGRIRRTAKAKRCIEIVEREESVTLSPHVGRAVSEYARRHHTTTEVAANELLAEYLGKVA